MKFLKASIKVSLLLLFSVALNLGFTLDFTTYNSKLSTASLTTKNSGHALDNLKIDTNCDLEEEVNEEDEDSYESIDNRFCKRIRVIKALTHTRKALLNKNLHKLYILYKQLKINLA